MFECLLLLAGEGRPRWASVDYASLSFALLEKDGRGDGIQFPPTLNPRRRQTDDDITALTQNNGPPSLPDFLRTNHAMHPSRRERGGGKTRTTGPFMKDVRKKGFQTPSPLLP